MYRIMLRTGGKLNQDGSKPLVVRLRVRDKDKRYDKSFKLSKFPPCKPEDWDPVKNRYKRSIGNKVFELNASLNALDNKFLEWHAKASVLPKDKYIDTFLYLYNKAKNPEYKRADEQSFIDHAKRISDNRRSYNELKTIKGYLESIRRWEAYWSEMHPKDNPPTPMELNHSMVTEFISFLHETGSTKGGVSVRLRALRSLYYEMRKDEDIMPVPPRNPFQDLSKRLDKISTGKGHDALSEKEWEKWKKGTYIDASGIEQKLPEHLDFWREMYMALVYAQGCNFVDMIKFKESDIKTIETDDGRKKRAIIYTRSKTKDATSSRITIYINEELQALFDKYRGVDQYGHLLPLLREWYKDEEKHFSHLVSRKKTFNKNIRLVAKSLKIRKHLTIYTSRTTFANLLWRKDISLGTISNLMGHRTEHETRVYLRKNGIYRGTDIVEGVL